MVRTLVGRLKRVAQRALLRSGYNDPAVTTGFTRASNGTYRTSDGTILTAGNNVLRRTNGVYVTTNLTNNPRLQVTSGVTPQFTTVIINPPFTFTAIGSGVDDGIPYYDFRMRGIGTAGIQHGVFFDVPTGSPVIFGLNYTASYYVKILQSVFPFSNLYLSIQEYNSVPTLINTIFNAYQSLPTGTFSTCRLVRPYTPTSAAVVNARLVLLFDSLANTNIDIVFRIGGTQLEPGSVANTLALPAAGTTGPSALYSGNRVLAEGARTNGIRNPRAEGPITQTGVVSGGGVTVATNWPQINHASGLLLDSAPITAFGMNGVRIRLYGTTTGTPGSETVEFDARNVFAAVAGTAVTGGYYIRLVAGNYGTVFVSPRIITLDAGAAVVDNTTGATTVLTPALQHVTQTLVPTGAAAFAIIGANFASFPVSTALDFTYDIFYPQIETGLNLTTNILPPVGVPGASSRAPDNLTVPVLSSWFRTGTPAGTGTFTFRGYIGVRPTSGFCGCFEIDDGTFNNRLYVYVDSSVGTSSTTSVYMNAANAGAYNGTLFVGNITYGVEFSVNVTFTTTTVRAAVAGSAPVSMPFALPLASFNVVTIGGLGPGVAAGAELNGSVVSFNFVPYVFTDYQLTNTTT